ncbi:MAG: hypothetical protein Q8928_13175 [Bacteroidota bacterium]|nr:hypothetical protein [Bacteroidota bacterium]
MSPKTIDSFQRLRVVAQSVKKNSYLLQPVPSNIQNFVGINGRLILSNNLEFLEAVRDDIGGEIIFDNVIGTFLYYNIDCQA